MVIVYVKNEQFDVHLSLVVKCCLLNISQAESIKNTIIWVNQLV